ncbi:MAG: TetR/AcrR family transcriptional regulator [Butyricicoccaceae bacterium]
MNTQSKRPDRRVIKTKKAIRGAFAQLVSEKELGSITIKELAAAADINRKTFYNYYSDIGGIIDEIEDELVAALENALRDVDLLHVLQNPYQLFSRLTAAISENLDFYIQIFRRESNAGLTNKLITRLKSKIRETFAGQMPVEQGLLDMAIDYSLAGMVEVYKKWLRSDRSVPLETVSACISKLAFAGLGDLLKT